MKKLRILLLLAVFACVCRSSFALTQGEFNAARMLENPQEDSKAKLLDRPRLQYTSTDQRDPFRMLIVRDEKAGTVQVAPGVEEKPPQMTVQGIMWGGAFPVAIINDELFRVGDTTKEGAKITSITKDGIEILYQEKNFEILPPRVQ